MPDQNPPETDGTCAFCQPTQHTLLHQGRDFFAIADYAPLAAAHILLIPRAHFPHLAALPPELDAEFEDLKARLGAFVKSNFGALAYWENGGFGQSVPHAHLHVVSLSLEASPSRTAGEPFLGLAGLRARHALSRGAYFTVEDASEARFLPPDPLLYGRVVQHARETNGGSWVLSRDERRVSAGPVMEALVDRWRTDPPIAP